ncbi:SRPBCC domain-containing protein [Luteimonas sp. MC1572]|uniref:SRPBCC family protein n=1 Tax=Luteimonas sp. MC1572 TaxID=2799325 RepID=UPI0018F09FEE|nr:SRPBCC domain-containing protein [Luteimonas sp. MC1572]MBJ6982161.1 SRPBCC domain-containing protein [Luteimonas sp. MC1572]QQO04453.1 SRPBCC domain-containing protein [Luteimonas sp. MC1572]
MTREIHHSFLVHASVETVMDALTKEEHIRNWWTKEVELADGKGRFGWSGHGWSVELDMEHDVTARRVRWTCTRSNMQDTHAWEGTTISFALAPENQGTRIAFAQTGYRESPCFDACEQGWAYFVGVSLKQYVETGKGIPYPEMQDTRQEQGGADARSLASRP